MKQLFSNATVYFNEQEIIEREALIQQCYQIVRKTWQEMNSAVKFARVETPILTPQQVLFQHLLEGFPLLAAHTHHKDKVGQWISLLRPEIAGGCFAAFFDMFPNESQRLKMLPFCVWQAGKSFRNEDNADTMRASKLRLREFWQLEFELICGVSTKANYVDAAVRALIARFGGEFVNPSSLPHYSQYTADWEINGLEIAGCSIRKDLEGYLVHEVSIGLDRLLAMVLNK